MLYKNFLANLILSIISIPFVSANLNASSQIERLQTLSVEDISPSDLIVNEEIEELNEVGEVGEFERVVMIQQARCKTRKYLFPRLRKFLLRKCMY